MAECDDADDPSVVGDVESGAHGIVAPRRDPEEQRTEATVRRPQQDEHGSHRGVGVPVGNWPPIA